MLKSKLIFALIIAYLLHAIIGTAIGAPNVKKLPPLTVNGPTKVWIDTYLFDIDDFNLMKGSYEMIFYLGTRCIPNCNKLNFEFINGKALLEETHLDTPGYKYYRITARLSQDLDFRQYPFEKHNLHIILEDKYLDNQKLQFFPDIKHSGLNRHNLLGWDEEPKWSAKVINYHYPNYNEVNSRYIFTMQIERPVLAGILKNIVPGVFIMLVGFLTMFLNTNKAVNGLAITSGALISMILLHLSDISSIPENGYMTYLDGFMIINYFGLLILLAKLVALINSSRFKAYHRMVYRLVCVITPTIWAGLQLANCLYFFLLTPTH